MGEGRDAYAIGWRGAMDTMARCEIIQILVDIWKGVCGASYRGYPVRWLSSRSLYRC